MTRFVLQLSDTHLRQDNQVVHGQNPDNRLQRVLAVCQGAAPVLDLVVLSGDLTDDGRAGPCQRLRRALEPLAAPILAVPGNHDNAAAVSEAFPGLEADLGGWRFIGINTSRPGQVHGALAVDDELNRAASAYPSPTLLVMHHPPASPSTHPWFQLDGGADLLSGLDRSPHVKAFLTGHLHEAFRTRPLPSAPPVIGCPSTLIAVTHVGESLRLGRGVTGAHLFALHDDGTLSFRLIQA